MNKLRFVSVFCCLVAFLFTFTSGNLAYAKTQYKVDSTQIIGDIYE